MLYLVVRQVIDDFGHVVEEVPVNAAPDSALALLDCYLEDFSGDVYISHVVEAI